MNRTDAAAVLSIDPSASPEEAKRAYQELFTEHQVRLTNAPTPALRSLYQSRLLELDEARDAFLAPSFGDADSDLPTDQPSIPSPVTREPPRTQQQPPPREPERKTETTRERIPEPKAEKKEQAVVEHKTKRSFGKTVVRFFGWLIVIGVAAVVVFAVLLRYSNSTDNAQTTKADSSFVLSAWEHDSLPKLLEPLTIARVEFNRGDYDAANTALKDGDAFYNRLTPDIAGSDSVAHLKNQLDSLHAKVSRACDALKKVAERHPGEPVCKSS